MIPKYINKKKELGDIFANEFENSTVLNAPMLVTNKAIHLLEYNFLHAKECSFSSWTTLVELCFFELRFHNVHENYTYDLWVYPKSPFLNNQM